jgi:hypothetical protein
MMATRLARPSIKPLGVRSMTLLSELKRQIEAPQEVPVPGDNPFALLALYVVEIQVQLCSLSVSLAYLHKPPLLHPYSTAARPVSFGLDEDALRTTQKTLLRQYHPDHWAQQSKTLAAQAMRYTAAVNRAVDRLLDPVERGVIMVRGRNSLLCSQSTLSEFRSFHAVAGAKGKPTGRGRQSRHARFA